MSIQPINSISGTFTGKTKTTDKGNVYETSNIGKTTGLISGLVLAGALMHSQMSALKTINGKKNLIEGFHIRGKKLNDIMPRKIVRNEEGKIVPPDKNGSARTKSIIKGFKNTLALWGAVTTAVATTLGGIADTSITSVRAKEADAKAAKTNV